MNEIKEFVSEEFIFDSIPKPSLGRITEPELETRNSKPETRNPKHRNFFYVPPIT